MQLTLIDGRTLAVPVVVQLDASGNASAMVGWNTLQFPGPNPQVWNFP